jgi:hypothetical protein
MSTSGSKSSPFAAGDVLFLERPIPGIPWPTGYFVVLRRTEGSAAVSLLRQDAQGLCPSEEAYTISVEDFAAFTVTGERARVPSKRAD